MRLLLLHNMRRYARILLLFLLAAMGLSQPACAQIAEVGDGGPGPYKAEHLTVELTSLSPQIPIGGHVTAGLILTLEEHWHVYWINAGDSGEPPKIKWTLPKGITAGPLQFPPPQRLPLGPFMDYGYEDQVAFPIELTASPSLKPGKVHLDAHVSWIVCSDRCFPGKGHVGLDLTAVAGPVVPPPVVGALGESIGWLAKPLPEGTQLTAIAGEKSLALTWRSGEPVQDAEFYPFDQDVIANAADQIAEPLPDGIRLRLERAPDPSGKANALAPLPAKLHGLLKLGKEQDSATYEFTIPFTPGQVPPASPAARKSLPADVRPGTADVTLWSAISLAFLGGVILNLMPCVFPVLFLKGLALLNSSSHDRALQRRHGFIYTLGILVSFWVIVGVLLALRAGGQQLGWGFQLQSAGFVAVLAMIMFFLGLSLAGQFELGLSLTAAGNDLTRKPGVAGSFFTGMLAVVAATPCMGPLMGAAVGFALAQPMWITFVVFTALALGLALPYLVLSMQPQWTRVLPRPGAWMEVLKQFTAIPLFATAIWLTWVFGRLHGTDSALAMDKVLNLLAAFLVLAIAGWALGRWPAKWGSAIAAIVLGLCAVALPLRQPKADALTWKPWTPASLAAARASGHPVFVDFTAAWCLSCQVNERVVLHSSDVIGKLNDANVELLKADWTNYDPAITASLAAVNRSGVPTYVLYPAGEKSNPDVLPELLTKDLVLKAIERDTKKPDEQK